MMRTTDEWLTDIWRASRVDEGYTPRDVIWAIRDEVREECCKVIFKEGLKFARWVDLVTIVRAIKR